MNYFSSRSAAERYKAGRPYYHEATIERIKNFCGFRETPDLGVDVACGTGLSTLALSKICKSVIGIDNSIEMLRIAEKAENIRYKLGTSEAIDIPDHAATIMTVASGLHWFDIEKFLAEAQRVIEPAGWLVIYENAYPGDMEGLSTFKDWYINSYHAKFPQTSRNRFDWNQDVLAKYDFSLVETETHINTINWNIDDLIRYLTTHSNVINEVENGKQTIGQVDEWLKDELTPFFPNKGQRNTLIFSNWIRYLKKVD